MILLFFKVFFWVAEIVALLVKCAMILSQQVIKVFHPKPHKDMDNRVVVITGAGSGIGRELSIRMARLGAIVVPWDIDRDLVENTANDIRREGGVAHPMTVDVSDEKSVEAMAKQIRQEVGDVYMVINNAGVCPCLPFNQLTYQQIRRTFDVNVLSHFWTIKQFLPLMEEKRKGHIVAIASSAGIMGSAYFSAYGSSKYGVVGLMASLDRELHEQDRRKDIKLTTICPLGISGTRIDIPTRTRFPRILPIMTLDDAVDQMMDAILKDEDLVVIPFTFKVIYFINRLFPMKVSQYVFEFLDYAVEPHGYNAPISRSLYHTQNNDLDISSKNHLPYFTSFACFIFDIVILSILIPYILYVCSYKMVYLLCPGLLANCSYRELEGFELPLCMRDKTYKIPPGEQRNL